MTWQSAQVFSQISGKRFGLANAGVATVAEPICFSFRSEANGVWAGGSWSEVRCMRVVRDCSGRFSSRYLSIILSLRLCGSATRNHLSTVAVAYSPQYSTVEPTECPPEQTRRCFVEHDLVSRVDCQTTTLSGDVPVVRGDTEIEDMS